MYRALWIFLSSSPARSLNHIIFIVDTVQLSYHYLLTSICAHKIHLINDAAKCESEIVVCEIIEVLNSHSNITIDFYFLLLIELEMLHRKFHFHFLVKFIDFSLFLLGINYEVRFFLSRANIMFVMKLF